MAASKSKVGNSGKQSRAKANQEMAEKLNKHACALAGVSEVIRLCDDSEHYDALALAADTVDAANAYISDVAMILGGGR